MLRPVFGLGPDMLIYSYPLRGQTPDQARKRRSRTQLPAAYSGGTGLRRILVIGWSQCAARSRSFQHRAIPQKTQFRYSKLLLQVLVLLPATAGKLSELQTGVSRISDMTMTFAIMAGVLVLYELIVDSPATETF